MAISGVGTRTTGQSTGRTTLAVSPTTIGDLLVFMTFIGSTTVTVATVSGGGVTTWSRIVGPYAPAGGFDSMDMWMGQITTTGASTITITGSSSISTFSNILTSQQFTAGAGMIWAVDGTQTGTKLNTASTTVTYPTLTPGAAGRLYFGYGQLGAVGSATGQTAGYTLQSDAGSEPLLYNASVATAQSPTSVMTSSGTSATIAALITATPAPVSGVRLLSTPLVPRMQSFNY